MLRWALIFLIIALAAGVLHLYSLEGMAMDIARILLIVFIVLLIISFIGGPRLGRFGRW